MKWAWRISKEGSALATVGDGMRCSSECGTRVCSPGVDVLVFEENFVVKELQRTHMRTHALHIITVPSLKEATMCRYIYPL